jgi:hypothetical protein
MDSGATTKSDLYLDIHNRLNGDLKYFADKAPFMIKDKQGRYRPFILNKAQEYIHSRLQEQLKKKTKVRAIILKGRQQGCSTYIAARFYHKTRQRGKTTFILSHESSTTDKLFKLVKRYHENIHPTLAPETAGSNRKELVFESIASEYAVGTAGNKEVGRGGTVQYFHGSEAAFWPNTDEIKAGLMQSIADLPDTEVILESTANGLGNMFHSMCMDAMNKKGDYELIFVPWFWQEEYVREYDESIVFDEDDLHYQRTYKLSNEQMLWRHYKQIELGKIKFKQEYPANPIEAFQASGDSLIKPETIMDARTCDTVDNKAPLIMGVDPARTGDRTVIAFRRGREVPIYYSWDNMDSMRLTGICAKLMDKHDPAQVFIDVGLGYGTIDRLKELGYQKKVTAVHFGATALENDIYINKRAEMWCNMRDWFNEGGVSIPDDDDLHADLACVPDHIETSSGKIKLVEKSKIKQDFGRSPDIGDAIALTFAFPVSNQGNREIKKVGGKGGPLKTMKRRSV